ncbi:MAG: glycosyl transferase family 2 [Actinobacteria bacterium 13_1_20CM_2_65_11]|nr:MAG: glycosyl transferase family 2 [Actinobacteria bacterium 13_1_20CM_2_65_11]
MSVVVPVYNEGENVVATLRGVIERAHTRPLEVLLVYDFDEDTTVPVVERLQSELPELRLHRNTLGRGVLNALKSGLAAARAPYVLVTMGDGSDDPGEIDAMYALANSGADVVAGSRYMRGGHQLGGPLLKRSMSRVAGLSLHWLGGLPIHDATSNYRMYSKRLLQRVTIESSGGFELGIELTVKAYALGMRVAEVPTTWRDRTAGQSRFRLWKWLPRYLRWYWVGIGARFKRTAS